VNTLDELKKLLARAICNAGGDDPDGTTCWMGPPTGKENWHLFDAEADAALSAFRQWLADEGLVVVPRKATEEMLINGARAHDDFFSQPGPYARTKAVHRAMIDAAPDVLGKP